MHIVFNFYYSTHDWADLLQIYIHAYSISYHEIDCQYPLSKKDRTFMRSSDSDWVFPFCQSSTLFIHFFIFVFVLAPIVPILIVPIIPILVRIVYAVPVVQSIWDMYIHALDPILYVKQIDI